MRPMEPEARSHLLSYLGWSLVGAGLVGAGVLDYRAVRDQERFCTMTEDSYRLHRLARATVLGAAFGAAFEHFVAADGK